jgi:hypothetical protein
MSMPNVLETLEYLDLLKSENNQVETISREDRAWLAGIIDGEGTFCVRNYPNKEKNDRKVMISISNTNPFLLKKISEIYVKIGIKFCWNLNMPRRENQRQYMAIHVFGNGSIKKLISLIYDFLTAKKKQADLMLEYLSWREQYPSSGGNNSEICFLIKNKFVGLCDSLHVDKRIFWDLQRLPRHASKILDLSKLSETMV